MRIINHILESKQATHYDKYQAYLQKALTYKRIYNYNAVDSNLDKAYQEGIQTPAKKEVETRILVEKALINFDQAKKDKFLNYLSLIKKEDLNIIDPATKAFLIISIADNEINNNHLSEAKAKLDEAIDILEKNDPRHLSLAYIRLGNYYRKLNNTLKEREAFYKALDYAETSKIDVYRIGEARRRSSNTICFWKITNPPQNITTKPIN